MPSLTATPVGRKGDSGWRHTTAPSGECSTADAVSSGSPQPPPGDPAHAAVSSTSSTVALTRRPTGPLSCLPPPDRVTESQRTPGRTVPRMASLLTRYDAVLRGTGAASPLAAGLVARLS